MRVPLVPERRDTPADERRRSPEPTPADAILALQRSAGNAAVARRVKIGKAIGSTDKAGAAAKAEELRAVRLAGQWGPAQDERVYHFLEFFEGEALHEFIRTLAYTEKEQSHHGGRTINDPGGGNFTIGAASAIFPVSKPREARGGFKVSYFAQVFAEDSESTSVEVSTEWSGGVEASVSIPIKKIFNIKVSGGVKKSRKTSEKEESKKAKRVGTGITQNFTVKKLERDVFQINFIERNYGYRLDPWEENPEEWEDRLHPIPAGHLPTKSKATNRGSNPRVVLNGWQLVPEESGPPWDPIWNRFYDFEQDRGSALEEIFKILADQQRALAEMLVFGE